MNTRQEITDLTVCRAFFAAWVFIYHVDLYLNFSAFLGPFAGLIRHGYLGVDGFFMLSGLILARVHPELARSPAGAFKFWGKRLARIYPVHLATILIFAAIFWIGLAHGITPRDPARFSLSSLVQNLFLVHGWGFASQGAWNYPSWSVSTEWAGYLLFPVLWLAVSYFDSYVAIQFIIIGFALLGLIITKHDNNLNLTFSDGLIRFFPEFIMGLSTARFVPRFADVWPLKSLAIIGAVLVPLGVFLGFDLLALAGIWLVLFAFTMQADAERPALLGQAPLLRQFGLLSYSFYMSFAVAELLLSQWFRHQNWAPASHALIFAGGMLAITLILAVFLHTTIEVPCRRRVDNWLKQDAPPEKQRFPIQGKPF
jgi:peptidoglycan/LPS O-acetylase OafA/YrhL